MLAQIGLGIALMTATTFVHTGCTGLLIWVLAQVRARRWGVASGVSETFVIAGVVVLLFIAALVEAAIWAATFLYLGAMSTLEESLYFSIVTFTTLGFGDITLNEDWRLLGSFEAANGIVLFGWSTALVFAFIQHTVRRRLSPGSTAES